MFVDWILKKVFFFPSEKVNVIGLHVQIRLQNWFDTIMSCASGLLALYFCCCCFQSMNAISSLKMFSALVNASPMYLNTARHRRALTMIQSLNSDLENNQCCWVYKRKYFNKKRTNKITSYGFITKFWAFFDSKLSFNVLHFVN